MSAHAKTEPHPADEEDRHFDTLVKEASKQSASMIQRLANHREKIGLVVKELASEREELLSRREHLRRQAELVDQGFSIHIADIEATLKLYEGGLNSLPVRD